MRLIYGPVLLSPQGPRTAPPPKTRPRSRERCARSGEDKGELVTRNKTGLFLAVFLVAAVVLGCKQLGTKSGANDEPPKQPVTLVNDWKSYDLEGTDISMEFPGVPVDHSPADTQIPAGVKNAFSSMKIYSYDSSIFSTSATELAPVGKRSFDIKFLADTSMSSLKRQLPDLQYTLDVESPTKARYNGSFSRGGKSYELRGCCVYKKADPARVWAILTLYQTDVADASQASQRVIDSVTFKGATESCK